MGDVGARMLAKAIQLNTKLRTIYWDQNLTSPQGFTDIAAALDKLVFLHVTHSVFMFMTVSP